MDKKRFPRLSPAVLLLPFESQRNTKLWFSDDRKYRYVLWRDFGGDPTNYILFICLNPSTADETKDDNTVRRCMGYGREWGYKNICIANIFAYRATDPRELRKIKAPVGIANNFWLIALDLFSDKTIIAWGNHGKYLNRDEKVLKLLEDSTLYCLGKTMDGTPKHPLYLSKSITPEIYRMPGKSAITPTEITTWVYDGE